MAMAQDKKSRLEARVDPEIYALMKRAAEIEGRTLTDFVVAAASLAARQTVESIEVLRLSRAQQEFMAALLDDPPPLSPAMERAVARQAGLIASK